MANDSFKEDSFKEDSSEDSFIEDSFVADEPVKKKVQPVFYPEQAASSTDYAPIVKPQTSTSVSVTPKSVSSPIETTKEEEKPKLPKQEYTPIVKPMSYGEALSTKAEWTNTINLTSEERLKKLKEASETVFPTLPMEGKVAEAAKQNEIDFTLWYNQAAKDKQNLLQSESNIKQINTYLGNPKYDQNKVKKVLDEENKKYKEYDAKVKQNTAELPQRKQFVDFSKSEAERFNKPGKEEWTLEGEAAGILGGFNKAVSDMVVKPFAGAAKVIGDALGIKDEMLSEKIYKYYDKYAERNQPQTLTGQVVSGVTSAIPLIAVTSLTGGQTLPLVIGTQKGLNNVAEGKDFSEGALEGVKEGLAIEAMGMVGRSFGEAISKQYNLATIPSKVATAVGMGGAFSIPDITKSAIDSQSFEGVNSHEALQSFLTGAAFEAAPFYSALKEAIKEKKYDRAQKLQELDVYNTIFQSPNEVIKDIVESPVSSQELYAKAIELSKKENPTKEDKIAFQAMMRAAGGKQLIDQIAANPEYAINEINTADLTPQQKSLFIDRVNAIDDMFNADKQEANDLAEEIKTNTEKLNSIPENSVDPIDDARNEANRSELKRRLEESKKKLQDIFKNRQKKASEQVNLQQQVGEGAESTATGTEAEKVITPTGEEVVTKKVEMPAEGELTTAEIVEKMQPFTDEMAKLEIEFSNNGYDIGWDYDNEIIITDKKTGEIVDVEELPSKLLDPAQKYEQATSELGNYDYTAYQESIEKSRKNIQGEEVEYEEIKPKAVEQSLKETPQATENEKEPTKTEDGKPLSEGVQGVRTQGETGEKSTELRTEEEVKEVKLAELPTKTIEAEVIEEKAKAVPVEKVAKEKEAPEITIEKEKEKAEPKAEAKKPAELPQTKEERLSKLREKAKQSKAGKAISSAVGAVVSKAKEVINWAKQKEGVKEVKISARNPVVTQAAKDLKEGRITSEEYRAVVSGNSPIAPVTQFFEPATGQQVANSVDANKKQNANKPIEENRKVALRIDIPAFRNNNIWVISVHDGLKKLGDIMSYKNVARITDVVFGTQSPKTSLEIAAGAAKTSSVGRIFGDWKNFEGKTEEQKGENAKQLVNEIANDPSWVQVGMNPFRHSYFYDRSNDLGRPVLSADEVVQIGGLVYAKNVKYGDWNSEAFRVKGMLDKAGKPVYFQMENIGTKEPVKPNRDAKAYKDNPKKYAKDLAEYKEKKRLYEEDLEAQKQENEKVKNIFDRAEIEAENTSENPVSISDSVSPEIPKTPINISEADARPEVSLMKNLRIKMSDWIFGGNVGLGMSDTLRTGERDVVELDENGNPKTKKIRDEGGIGYPFKSLIDLLNEVKQKSIYAWAAVKEGAATGMINAAKKSKKITGRELKDHYIENLDLTDKQKAILEKTIPDNKEYGLVTIYKMGDDGIKSNEAFAKEAFRQMDVKLSEKEKETVLEIAKQRIKNLEWGEKGEEAKENKKKKLSDKEKYQDILLAAKSFKELEDILNGDKSDMSLGTKASIMQNVFLSSEGTTSVEKKNPLGKILKDKEISIESISRVLNEPIMEGVEAGQPMILIAVDTEGTVLKDEKRERHPNYAYGVPGFPVGIFNETMQMHHLSPEMMDTFVKTATTTVDEGVTVKGMGKETFRVSISHNDKGEYIAELGKAEDKLRFTTEKNVFLNSDGKYLKMKADGKFEKLSTSNAREAKAKSREDLIKMLDRQGFKTTKDSNTEYFQNIGKSNLSNLMQKAKKGIISVFEKPKATAQQKLVEYVKRSFPKIDVELDKNKFNEFVGDFKNKKLLNARQEVFGVVDSKTGKIYLNPELLNNNVPIHEMGHIWNQYTKEYRPDIHKKGVELVSNSKYTDFVLNNIKYEKFIKDLFGNKAIVYDKATGKNVINTAHPEFEAIKDYVYDEALSKAIGDKGEMFVNEAQKRNWEKFLDLLYAAIKKITGFDKFTTQEFQDLTLEDFTNAAAKELLGGEKISDIESKEIAALSKGEAKFSLGEELPSEDSTAEFVKSSLEEGYTDEEISTILEDDYGYSKDEVKELINNAKITIKNKTEINKYIEDGTITQQQAEDFINSKEPIRELTDTPEGTTVGAEGGAETTDGKTEELPTTEAGEGKDREGDFEGDNEVDKDLLSKFDEINKLSELSEKEFGKKEKERFRELISSDEMVKDVHYNWKNITDKLIELGELRKSKECP